MKCLVTGSCGFIGSHLVDKLCQMGFYPIGFDRKTGQSLLKCTLPAFENVDRVFHLAAETNAQSTDVMAHVTDTIAVSARIMRHYREKLVFSSSAAVNYPVTPYAISKKACEDFARLYGCAIVRLPNIHGNLGKPGHSAWDKFRDGEVISVYGDGMQIRTWCSVEMAVEALINADPGCLSILGGVDLTVNELATHFAMRADANKKVIRNLPRADTDITDGRQIYAPDT